MDKDSFMLKKSMYGAIEQMSNEHKGELFDAIYRYHNFRETPSNDSPILVQFGFFKNQFKIDQEQQIAISNRNKTNGSKGGRPAKTKITKQKSKNPLGFQEVLEIRKKEFGNKLAAYVGRYPKEMIRKFYDYWTEKSTSGTRMKFEMQKTWELEKRLITWNNNNFDTGTNTSEQPTEKRYERI